MHVRVTNTANEHVEGDVLKEAEKVSAHGQSLFDSSDKHTKVLLSRSYLLSYIVPLNDVRGQRVQIGAPGAQRVGEGGHGSDGSDGSRRVREEVSLFSSSSWLLCSEHLFVFSDENVCARRTVGIERYLLHNVMLFACASALRGFKAMGRARPRRASARCYGARARTATRHPPS